MARTRQTPQSQRPLLYLLLAGVILILAYLYQRIWNLRTVNAVEDLIDNSPIQRLSHSSSVQHYINSNGNLAADTSFVLTELSARHEAQIRKALRGSLSAEGLTRVLSDPNFKIMVAPEKFIRAFSNVENPSHEVYGYFQLLLNAILIDERFVDRIREGESDPFIRLILCNEMSHALTRHTKMQRMNFSNNYIQEIKIASTLMFPWINKTELNATQTAHKQYEEKIEYYKTLSNLPHKKLTAEQSKELQSFNRALKDYKPIQGQLWEILGRPSPYKISKQHRNWLRHTFFADREIAQRALKTNSLYQRENAEMLLGECITDFDMLPPKLQILLGGQLCEILNKLHSLQPDQYCSRYSLTR